MVKLSYENMFNSGMQTLVCTTNTVGAMGAGNARVFRDTYNGLIERYRKDLRNGKHAIGKPVLYKYTGAPNVLCMATKGDWRAGSKLEYITASLERLSEFSLVAAGVTELGLPLPGCGNGGLDPRIVLPIIVNHFNDFTMPVTIFLSRQNGMLIGGV